MKQYSVILLIILLRITSYTMEPAKKKIKTEELIKQSLVTRTISAFLPREIAQILNDYCSGPYFVAQYINDTHEQHGEDITQVAVSPDERTIATSGFNAARDTYSFRLHDAALGKQFLFNNLENQQPYDMSWNCFSTEVALTYGEQITTIVNINSPTNPTESYAPAHISDENYEYYCLRNQIQKGSSTMPSVPVLTKAYYSRACKIKQFEDIDTIQLHEEKNSPVFVDKVAFLKKDCIIAWQSSLQMLTVRNQELYDYTPGVTSVDFSTPQPTVGYMDGKIKIFNPETGSAQLVIHAFDDISVELIATYPQALAAVAQKKVKIFDRKTRAQIGGFEHVGPDNISHVVLSPDLSMVAYAVNKTLHAKSARSGEALQCHIFKNKISSLDCNSKGDLLVTHGGQIIKLLKDHTDM